MITYKQKHENDVSHKLDNKYKHKNISQETRFQENTDSIQYLSMIG